jgi:hypothetical protein
MASSIFLTALLLSAIVAGVPAVAYAQEGGMTATTSKGTLDVMLEPTQDPNDPHKYTFNVSFLEPGTDTLHQHQDYDFRILKDGTEVFSAAKQTGQALIHNVPGTITVPYTFQENGSYTIQVYLGGTGIPAIPTDEDAMFQLQVVPEFPAAVLGGMVAALMATAIVLARYRRLF